MKQIIGKKIGMTRVYNPAGEAVPVTVIQAGPCTVIAKRTADKEGYNAYQVGFGDIDEKRAQKILNKPQLGQFASAKVSAARFVRELNLDDATLEVGSVLKLDIFNEGEKVDVTGISRGLGFAGTMKRHNFGGGPITHGQSDRQRAPGSVGQSSFPSRVFKGLRMAGRMGRDKVTVLNLEIVRIIENENLMLVKGAVPGNKGSIVKIRSTNRGYQSFKK
jgi:large subunit ribosomal protein L3